MSTRTRHEEVWRKDGRDGGKARFADGRSSVDVEVILVRWVELLRVLLLALCSYKTLFTLSLYSTQQARASTVRKLWNWNPKP